MYPYEDDPLEAAAHVQPPIRTYFGQARVTSFFCVLEKGIGKLPFDPQVHKPEQRRVAIRIELEPLTESNLQFTVMRELIAESKAWTGVILPSLVALGISPRDLNEKWVQMELVPTGRQWLNSAGEQKEETMPRFVAVYPDRAACLAAFSGSGVVVPPAGNGNGSSAQPQVATAADPERVAAAAFLKPMWAAAQYNTDKLVEMIAKNPILARHFTLESPEVLALVNA